MTRAEIAAEIERRWPEIARALDGQRGTPGAGVCVRNAQGVPLAAQGCDVTLDAVLAAADAIVTPDADTLTIAPMFPEEPRDAVAVLRIGGPAEVVG